MWKDVDFTDGTLDCWFVLFGVSFGLYKIMQLEFIGHILPLLIIHYSPAHRVPTTPYLVRTLRFLNKMSVSVFDVCTDKQMSVFFNFFVIFISILLTNYFFPKKFQVI
jgi:hypothetical protein